MPRTAVGAETGAAAGGAGGAATGAGGAAAASLAALAVGLPAAAGTVISTERGFQTGKGVFKSPRNDNHLRAVVDKRSGATRFEVRQTLTYPGSIRGYSEVSHQTGQWPVAAPLTTRVSLAVLETSRPRRASPLAT